MHKVLGKDKIGNRMYTRFPFLLRVVALLLAGDEWS
jgi:hypothetical protein